MSGTDTTRLSIDTIALRMQAESLFQRGEKFRIANKPDSALWCHQQALAIREKSGLRNAALAESYYLVGRLFSDKLKYDIADAYLENARVHADNITEINPRLYFDIYFFASDCKANMLDFASAISLANKCLDIVRNRLQQDPVLLSRVHQLQSSIYFYKKDYPLAFRYLEQSISLIPKDNHRSLGRAYNTMGIYRQQTKDLALSLIYYNRSIQEHLKWTDQNSNELAKVYLQKATALLDNGNYDSSRFYLMRNLNIRKKEFGMKDPNTFGALLTLAQLDLTLGRYDSAIRYYHESLISLIHGFDDHNILTSPRPDQTELNNDLLLGLTGKADALAKVSDSGDLKWRKLSLKTYLLADSVFSIYRSVSSFDDPVLNQLEVWRELYLKTASVSFDLAQTLNDERYIEAGINAMERSRSVLLQSSLLKAEALGEAGIEASYKEKERKLTQQRNEILRSLATDDAIPPARYDSLNEKLLAITREFNVLQKVLRDVNPNYFELRYQRPSLRLKELQKLANDSKGVLLEYLWSDSILYVAKVTGSTKTLGKVYQDVAFKKAYHDFVESLAIDSDSTLSLFQFEKFCRSSNLLYRKLLLPWMKDIPPGTRLIISADGPLSVFPFEALIKTLPEKREVDYRLHYLMEDHAVSYAYSLGVLLQQNDKERHGNKLLAMGFAGEGPSQQVRSNLSNLPGTERELNAIKEVMKNGTNHYYFEQEANEAVFKNKVRDFNIVHLALHGISDSVNAMESKIIFRAVNDDREDGQLFAHELYDLNLNNLDMVVLSACETGRGKWQAGEGVMSIARGFAYAGCPSLIMSLWKLDDKKAAQVMSRFYTLISEKKEIDISLADAKRNYLRSTNEFNSHPAYWAAFIAVGNMNALKDMGLTGLNWIFILIALMAGGLLVYWHARRNHFSRKKA